MTQRYVIAGTDTDVGKTTFSAALMLALEEAGAQPYYWKPVQSGLESVDTRSVQDVTELPEERFFPETYIFSEPLSPHRAAEIDEIDVDINKLRDVSCIPECDGTLLIEGAGGLMVPMSRKNLQINIYKKWKIPLILCARTELGTINHTLLSLEALWSRRIPIKGIAFIGEPNADNMYTISKFSNVKVLGRLPMVEEMTADNLLAAFKEGFEIKDFTDSSDIKNRFVSHEVTEENDNMEQLSENGEGDAFEKEKDEVHG